MLISEQPQLHILHGCAFLDPSQFMMHSHRALSNICSCNNIVKQHKQNLQKQDT